MADEQTFMRRLMVALCAIDGVRVWRSNVGGPPIRDRTGKVVGKFDTGAPVGSADIVGIVGPYGWMLQIECKAHGAKTSKARTASQAAWGAFVGEYGGIYLKLEEPADGNVDAGVAAVRVCIAYKKALERC